MDKALSFVENLDPQEVLGSLDSMVQTFKDFMPIIAAVAASTIAYKGAVAISGIIDAVTKATEGQTVAQAALNAVMNANPFVLVATLIAGLITWLVTLYMTNEEFRDKVNEAWASVKEHISKAVETLKTFFTETVPNAINDCLDWFKSIPDTVKEVGKNLMEGLWNGINEKVQWLKSKVTGVVDGIKGLFTGATGFDTHSPSKWSKKVFGYVMDGAGEGLDDGLPDLMNTVGSVTDSVKSGMAFGSASIPMSASYLGSASASGTAGGNSSSASVAPIDVTLTLDGAILARNTYRYNQAEQTRHGSSLVMA